MVPFCHTHCEVSVTLVIALIVDLTFAFCNQQSKVSFGFKIQDLNRYFVRMYLSLLENNQNL